MAHSTAVASSTPPALADSVSLERRQINILPTRNGLLFAAVLLAMLIGAVNYNNSLAYLFTFLLTGISVVSILHTYRNVRGVILKRGKPEPVFAGDTVRFPIGIESVPPALPRFALMLNDSQGSQSVTDLKGGENRWTYLERGSCRRGQETLGPVTLSSRYPLGLFRASAHIHLEETVIVYPAPAESAPLPVQAAVAGAGIASTGRGSSGDFSGFRPYQPGDPLHHIAWKSVARGQEVLTKQFSDEAARELWLEWAQTPPGDLEQRLSRLCRWVLDAEAAGLRYGLSVPGTQIAPDGGPLHRDRCLTALALFGRSSRG